MLNQQQVHCCIKEKIMSFTNLITTAIDSVADEILSRPIPSVCELGNPKIKK